MTDVNRAKATAEKATGLEIVIQSFTLFFIVSYAPFTIAALLGDRFPSFPLSYFVALIFFFMAVGTLTNAFVTNTSLVVAPAVGMATFASDTSIDTISTAEFLIAAAMASALAFLLSHWKPHGRASARKEILDRIPNPIKMGVRGGIGALLAAAAVHNVGHIVSDERATAEMYRWALGSFIVGIVVLLLADSLKRNYQATFQPPGTVGQQARLMGYESANILVPFSLLFAFYFFGKLIPTPSVGWEHAPNFLETIKYCFPILELQGPLEASPLRFAVIVFFAMVILFVFITDTPGSPYDFFRTSGVAVEDEKRIERSFLVTSGMSMVHSVFGLFTAVYYAENHVFSERTSEKSSTVPAFLSSSEITYVTSALFLAMSLVFLFVDVEVKEIQKWLTVAIAPSLFCLGIHLTARAMKRDLEEEMEGQAGPGRTVGEAGASDGSLATSKSHRVPDLSFFLPVSLALLLTHFVGFEKALPIGILFYCVAARVKIDWPLGLLAFASAVLALFFLVLTPVASDKKKSSHERVAHVAAHDSSRSQCARASLAAEKAH